MITEQFVITIIASVLAVGAYLFFMKRKFSQWQLLSVSTLFLTGCLLLYYHFFIFDSSHGISIVILPLATWWLIWRRETAGKPAFTVPLFIIFQVIFGVLYVILTRIQEH